MIGGISFALALTSQSLAQRPIDTLSDAELCQAVREVTSRPGSEPEDFGPFDFRQPVAQCETKLLSFPIYITAAGIEKDVLQNLWRDAAFCHESGIQRFLQRGWRVDVNIRWADGAVRNVPACR